MDVEKRFWRIFNKTLGIDQGPATLSKDDVEEWDSLKHVELIFELEDAFELDVSPDDIVALYSDTDRVLAYLRVHAGDSE